MALMPVVDALQAILAAARPTNSTSIPLDQAIGATLAEPLAAKRTQPPENVSAMDGYAVRTTDLAPGAGFTLIGESAAGRRFNGIVGPGEAVRIFTGAILPEGADTVLLQENTERREGLITALQSEPLGRHIRRKGLDFNAGDQGLDTGVRLNERSIALAAAMGHGSVRIHRPPRVGILATGDELVLPGEEASAEQIVASNHLTIAAIVNAAGGEAIQLGIARDNAEALQTAFERARRSGLDVLVTLGGASVGEYDLVKSAMATEGMELGFWKIAMRPGKPMMFGKLQAMLMLGLPGNPVSSFVCAKLFLAPLIRTLLGDPEAGADQSESGIAGGDLSTNDQRMDFLRADLSLVDGRPVITPFPTQDSSMISIMSKARALLIRTPFAAAAPAGSPCRFLRL
jgi:molybdopterin molybdotransferase